MSKVLVIPDIHLKPWIFDKAETVMNDHHCDSAVLLGDIVDDWGQENRLSLYNDTLHALMEFVNRHPNTLFCIGNHDISYYWSALESGYSYAARETVLIGMRDLYRFLPDGSFSFMHRIDNSLFSHAGLMRSFVYKHFPQETERELDKMVHTINEMGRNELWTDDSPIWARPQSGETIPYQIPGVIQVVGHTPVKSPLFEDGVLSVDTFSTYRDGSPIGDASLIVLDSLSCSYDAYIV